MILQSTTIATLASQTSFTLTTGSPDNDAYNGMTIVIEDATTSEQKAVGTVSGYVGSTKTITLIRDPGIFTMVATDKITIVTEATASSTWDERLTGATHNIPTSSGKRLRQTSGIAMSDGTAQAGGVNTVTLASGESSTDRIYEQSYLAIVGGTGQGQGHHIITYDGTTKIAAIDDDWIIQPDSTSEYVIYGAGSHDEIQSGLAQAGSASTITLPSTASATDDLYNGNAIALISGTGSGQVRRITDYNGTTKVATISGDWITSPDATTGFYMVYWNNIANEVWNELLTSSTYNINKSAGKILRVAQETGLYDNSAVYVDTINGVAGTENYVNGIATNPVDNIADAKTIADSIGLTRFIIATNSLITLGSTFDGYNFRNHNWTLDLNGQDVSNSVFIGAEVSGVGTGTSIHFEDCGIGTITIPPAHFHRCGLEGAITYSGVGNYLFESCYSNIAGTGAPSIDFGSGIANTNTSMRSYSGGIEIKNTGVAGTDTMSLEGNGQLIINPNCTGGVVAIRGNITVTDNASGVVGLSDDARIDIGQINAQIADVLKIDTMSEIAQGVPPATPTMEEAINYIYTALINKLDVTATHKSFYNGSGTLIWKAPLTDNGNTYSEAKGITGP